MGLPRYDPQIALNWKITRAPTNRLSRVGGILSEITGFRAPNGCCDHHPIYWNIFLVPLRPTNVVCRQNTPLLAEYLLNAHFSNPIKKCPDREMNLCAVFLECQCDFSKSLRIWCQPTHDGWQTFVPSRLDHFGRIFWNFSTSIQNRSFKPNGFWS